ncbi:quinone oxidoreductase family protein [Roseateles chitosanitabidus]|uniref:quinone oxidoreductase family protein n=1 Tax=Roseateles chitosanitabidus TaxID=65048 RepID=UPI000831335B|nr:quinone oxidoreductase [Roseateles chitosanitabidus]
MKAMVMTRPGGPEVMDWLARPDPVPGPGQVLVEVAAAGVNFMDIGVRRGGFWSEFAYPKPLGVEGAGRVLAVGEGVRDLVPGRRVAWVYAPGSYADKLLVPAASLVPLPDAIDDRTAAAVMMQGLTASHFATEFHPIQPGEIALVHAAAGGLGLLLTQIIKLRGGTVIGRVSSADKVRAAQAAGADHVIVDREGRFADEVIRRSDGGVHVVYDGSGPATFQGSMDALRPAGTFAWFGPVLGGPAPIDVMALPRSIKLGYPVFMDHVRTTQRLRERSRQLFDWIEAGQLQVRVGGEFPLGEVARAHEAMESRTTIGKLLLIP